MSLLYHTTFVRIDICDTNIYSKVMAMVLTAGSITVL